MARSRRNEDPKVQVPAGTGSGEPPSEVNAGDARGKPAAGSETGPLHRELLEFLEAQISIEWDTPVPDEVKAVMIARLDQLLAEERSRADARIRSALRAVVRRERKRYDKIRRMEASSREDTLLRLSASLRLQHVVLLTSCILLIVTGLPLKFHGTAWAAFVFSLLGGVRGSGLIHRIAATGLIGVGVYHLCYIIFSRYGRRTFRQLLPAFKDVLDVIRQMKYYLGATRDRARFGKFSYVEKFDYWAVYWGMVIMICSGAMLWFEDISLRIFPKFVIDIAKEAHSDEALLATLAIIIWHFYNVHFNPDKFPMNRTWLTGRITKGEMMHEHPLEYEEQMAMRGASADGAARDSAEGPGPRSGSGVEESDGGGRGGASR
jgi:formate dehydrogenase subunit gamma